MKAFLPINSKKKKKVCILALLFKWRSNGSFWTILHGKDISTQDYVMPHIVPDRRRFSTTRENHTTQTRPSHSTSSTTTGNTLTRRQGGVRGRGSAHTQGTTRKHSETQKDAYSIPHPVPPKITPRARMVPATAPISLLVARFTVWREKRRFFLNKKNLITH